MHLETRLRQRSKVDLPGQAADVPASSRSLTVTTRVVLTAYRRLHSLRLPRDISNIDGRVRVPLSTDICDSVAILVR